MIHIFRKQKIWAKSLLFDAFLEPKRYSCKKVGFWCWFWPIPLGFKKGLKIIKNFRNWKYDISAFQNRSQKVSAMPRSDFTLSWSPNPNGQKRQKLAFLVKNRKNWRFSRLYRNRRKCPRQVLRPVLESLEWL